MKNSQMLRPLANSVTSVKAKHSLPDLPYDYNALEPVICAEIMQLHHSKHHQTYVNNYNVAEEKLAEAVGKGDASTVIGLHAPSNSTAVVISITAFSGKIFARPTNPESP